MLDDTTRPFEGVSEAEDNVDGALDIVRLLQSKEQLLKFLDDEEIVVKSLPQRLRQLGLFAGSTFTGEGSVGLILNISGLYDTTMVKGAGASLVAEEHEDEDVVLESGDYAEFLTFHLGCDHLYALPLEDVHRLERFESHRMRKALDQQVIVYRDSTLPILDLMNLLPNSAESQGSESLSSVIVNHHGSSVGLLIDGDTDIVRGELHVEGCFNDAYQKGSLVMGEAIFCVIDCDALIERNLKFKHKPKVELAEELPLDGATADAAHDTQDEAAGFGIF